MRQWILISSYLLRDICRRWLETPGALFARLLVATLLSLLLLFLQAAFQIAAHELEHRILQLGANNINVSLNRNSLNMDRGYPSLYTITEPLREHGDLLRLRMAFSNGTTELGESVRVLAYADSELPKLAAFAPAAFTGGALLASELAPPNIMLTVSVEGLNWQALTTKLPRRYADFADDHALLFMPEDSLAPLMEYGWRALALFSANETEAVPTIVDSLRQLLQSEGYRAYTIQSATGWQEELAELRLRQRQWQAGVAGACALLLVLVFGSIALLEYRQNAFIAALIRSFGIPRFALVGRYLMENVLLVAIAGALAFGIAIQAHEPLFALAGFDPAWTNRAVLQPYQIESHPVLIAALALSALLSSLPVAVAMRRPVGKVLS